MDSEPPAQNPFETLGAKPGDAIFAKRSQKGALRFLQRVRIPLLLLLALFVVGGTVAYFSKAQMFRKGEDWEKMKFTNAHGGKSALFYTGNVEEAIAERLVNYLKADPEFGSLQDGGDAVLDLRGGRFIVSFFMDVETPTVEFESQCEQFRLRIEEKANLGRPVTLEICERTPVIGFGKVELKQWHLFPESERFKDE
jgi:hypothetical protein